METLTLTTQITATLLAALAGGYVFRVRGVDEITLGSRTLERMIFTLPFPLVAAYHYLDDGLRISGSVFVITAALTYLAVVTGHGSYFGLGRNKKITSDDEKLAPVVRFLVPKRYGEETWAYQFVGMTIRGTVVTLIAGAMVLDWRVALSGSAMGMLYELSWRTPWSLKGNKWIPETKARFTQWGEWYFGAVTWAALAWSVM